MSLIGNIGEFVEGGETFLSYEKRISLFFKANKIDDSLKVASFLSIIGYRTFSLVSDLVSPKDPANCEYSELIMALKNHFEPQIIVIFERFKFYKRNQSDSESITEFAAAIKSLARTCEFENTLETMLRDKFVTGLRDDSTQRVLLTMKNLTYPIAYETAISRETAAKDVKAFSFSNYSKDYAINQNLVAKKNFNLKFSQKKTSSASNNSNQYTKYDKNQQGKPSNPCYGCGGMHFKVNCKHKNTQCNICKKVGHLAKMCFQKNTSKANSFYSGTTNHNEEFIF